MGDVPINFIGKIEQLENTVARAEGQILRLKDKIAEMNRAGRDGANEQASALERMQHTLAEGASHVAKLALGWTSVAGAIHLAHEGLSQWKELQEKIAHAQTGQAVGTAQKLYETGMGHEMPAVMTWINAQTKAGQATQEQAAAAIVGATRGAPQATLAQREAIAAQALKSAPYQTAEAGQGRAELIGRLSGVLPGKTPGQVESVLSLLQRLQPTHYAELTSPAFLRGLHALTDAGIAPEEALGLEAANMARFGSPRFVPQLGAKLQEEARAPAAHRGKAQTEKERIQGEWANASPAERWRLLSRPEVRATLSPEMAGQVEALLTKGPGYAAQIREAEGAALSDKMRMATGAAGVGQVAQAQQEEAVEDLKRYQRMSPAAIDRTAYGEAWQRAYENTGGPGFLGLRAAWLYAGRGAMAASHQERGLLGLGTGEENFARDLDSVFPGQRPGAGYLQRVHKLKQAAEEYEQGAAYRAPGQVPPRDPQLLSSGIEAATSRIADYARSLDAYHSVAEKGEIRAIIKQVTEYRDRLIGERDAARAAAAAAVHGE